jgi:L-2-hydroxyglutarate oxidase LhgO
MRAELVVVGAGIVGLATAREVLRRRPGMRVVILDKEAEVAWHQSGHNSGVVHSGIYYAPGSLKAQLCVAGAREIYAYAEQKGIPVERCGKLIVALHDGELPRLQELYRRGTANGVPGLELLGPKGIREHEPQVAGVAGIWSPATGIVDFRRVALALADDIRAAGGTILTSRKVTGLRETAGAVTVQTSGETARTPGETVVAERVLSCAGLHSDQVARLSGASADPVIVPFRGDYWQLRPQRRHLVRSLVYPVPDPALPFLGVHFTRRIEDGAIWLGPNAVLAFAREGYRRRDVQARELLDVLTNPGFLRLARRFWRTGGAELYRDFSKRSFVAACQRFVPELTAMDVCPGPSGVRAQSLGSDGALIDDFVVHRQGERLVHVRNAPSPAATSSLAIARSIADRTGWDSVSGGHGLE